MSTRQFRRIRKAAARVVEALESRMMLASIEGFKFNDLDGDGVRDADEPGLPGWTIYADLNGDRMLGMGEPSVVTNSYGGYMLTGLEAGRYHIREVPQAGWITTAPLQGGRLFAASNSATGAQITISELDPQTGERLNSFMAPGDVTEIGPQGLAVGPSSLFFVQGSGTAAHTLYELDLNTGAVIDSDPVDLSDPAEIDGIAYLNGKLYLQRFTRQHILVFDPGTDTMVATLNTNIGFGTGGMAGDPVSKTLLVTNGEGTIHRIDPQTGQTVGIVAITNQFITGVAVVQGTVYAAPYMNASNVLLYDGATGAALGTLTMELPGSTVVALGGDGMAGGPGEYVVTLTSGQMVIRDFGGMLGNLRGTKFNDLDADGVRDAGEPGLPGWTIYVDLDGDGALDSGEPTALTAADGSYAFAVPAGSYIVDEVAPAGWNRTTAAPQSVFALEMDYSIPGPGAFVAAEIDPETGNTVRTIPLPGDPGYWGDTLAYNGASLFYFHIPSTTLYEIDPTTGAVLDSDVYSSILNASAITVLGGNVFVEASGVTKVIDTATDTITREMSIFAQSGGTVAPFGAMAALRGPGQLVAWDYFLDTFSVLDADSGALVRQFGGGHLDANNQPLDPSGIAVRDGYSYVYWNIGTDRFIEVYSPAGELMRTVTAPEQTFVWGLAGEDAPRMVVAGSPAALAMDSGSITTGEIRGTKFNDRDGDGMRDENEEGLAGWTIYLDSDGDGELDADERTTVTGTNGQYVFTGVSPGTYLVEEVMQAGWKKTNPRGGRLFATQYANLPTGGISPMIAELDVATLEPVRRLAQPMANGFWGDNLAFNGSRLFFMRDSNISTESNTLYEVDPATGAVLDSDVLPLAHYQGLAVLGNTVYALGDNSVIVAFDTVSDTVVRTINVPALNWDFGFSSGLTALRAPGRLVGYAFAARQFVEIDINTGLEVRRFGSGPADKVPFGLAAADGRVYAVWEGSSGYYVDVYGPERTLERSVPRALYTWALAGDDVARATLIAGGQAVSGVDFGNQRAGVVRGVKYHDRNGNGTRDTGEEGLPGWTVYLDSDGDGVLDASEPSTVTNSDGGYAFIGLEPGDYRVEEVPQSGWAQTYPSGGRLFTVWPSSTTPMLTELNPKTGAVLKQMALPATDSTWGDTLAFNGSSVFYLPRSFSTTLYEIDSDSGAVRNTITVPAGQYYGVAAMGDSVYLANAVDHSLVKVDARTGTVTGTLNVGAANGYSIQFGWSLAALRGPGRLVGYDLHNRRFAVIDAETGVVQQTFGNGYTNDQGQRLIPSGLAVVGREIHAQWWVDGENFTDVYRLNGTFVRKVTTGYQWGMGGDAVSRVVRLSIADPMVMADFGGVEQGQVSGTKFNDRNGNGVREPGEEGLAGWTIYLDRDADSELDAGEPFAITDSSGNYLIEDVLTGNYVLDEVPQAGWRQTNRADVIFSMDYFGGTWGGSPNSAPGFLKINPTNGALIGWLPLPAGAPAFTRYSESLAYNGFDLYYVPGGGSRKLYRLDPQTGAVRGEFTLPEGDYRGAAVIGDTVYISQFGPTKAILAVNGLTGVVDRTMTPAVPYMGLAALRNPESLVTYEWYTKSIVELDPQTLAVRSTFRINGGANDWLYDLGAANGSIYVNWHHPGMPDTFDVFSRDGRDHWTLPLTAPNYRNGLGGDDVRMPVQVLPGSDINGRNIGGQRMVGEISGVIYQDEDRDGVQDAGEGPLSGWIAYVDADRDHQWDEGEAFAITDADGRYSIANVDVGEQVVEVHPVLGLRQTTPSGRMFALVNDGTSSIVELNATTGEELRRFAAPVAFSGISNGLAYDGVSLYMTANAAGHLLYAIEPDSGVVTRAFIMPAGNFDGLAVLGDRLYLQDSNSRDIFVVNKISGVLENTLDIRGTGGGVAVSGGLAAIHGPDALIASANDGTLIVEIDPLTGLVTRQYPITGPLLGIAVADGGVWYGTGDSQTLRFRTREGLLLRQGRPLDDTITALGGDDNGRTVRVTLGGTATASFGFAWDDDVSDVMATAVPVTLDATLKEMATETIGDGLFGNWDVDLYQFTASVNDELTVAATGVIVRVFDATGMAIGGTTAGTWLLPCDGTYYIGVSGYGNGMYNPTMGNSGEAGVAADYTLMASITQPLPTFSGLRIDDGGTQRSVVRSLTVTFSEPVTLGAGAVTLRLHSGAAVADVVVNSSAVGDGMSHLLTFSGPGVVGGSLPDGVYDLIITGADVSDATGQVMSGNTAMTFHRLYGDINGDRTVNMLDYRRFRLSLGRSAGQALFESGFDFESNGVVNLLDLKQFRRRFGARLRY